MPFHLPTPYTINHYRRQSSPSSHLAEAMARRVWNDCAWYFVRPRRCPCQMSSLCEELKDGWRVWAKHPDHVTLMSPNERSTLVRYVQSNRANVAQPAENTHVCFRASPHTHVYTNPIYIHNIDEIHLETLSEDHAVGPLRDNLRAKYSVRYRNDGVAP